MDADNINSGTQQQPAETQSRMEEASPQEHLACLEDQLAQKEDRILRLRADFENYRKRMQREMPSLLSREKEHLLLKFLEVYENLVAACQAQDDQGLRMVRDQFNRVLHEEGIAEIPTVGHQFDYQCHHAVASQPSRKEKEGLIIQEISKGYTLNDRVIKPAYVVVSKGDTND